MQRPIWVKAILVGVKSRNMAMAGVWFAALLALFVPLHFAVLMLALSLWAWLATRWVDRHQSWPESLGVGHRISNVITIGIMTTVLTVALIKPSVIHVYRIPQGGMFPTFREGARFIAKKNPYHAVTDIQRGDIIVFQVEKPEGIYDFVWRVVGLPGDKIAILGEDVMVNGQTLKHEWVRQEGSLVILSEVNGASTYQVAYDRSAPLDQRKDLSVTVPPEHVFTMGDNRFNAYDSRFTGSIPFSTIIGKRLFQ